MSKYLVSVLDANSLISSTNSKFIDFEALMMPSRYPATKTYGSLYDEWHQKYGISPANQILFQLQNSNNHMNLTEDWRMWNLESLRMSESTTIANKQNFLLFDSRKLIIVTTEEDNR